MSDVAVLSELRERLTAAENAGDTGSICPALARVIVSLDEAPEHAST